MTDGGYTQTEVWNLQLQARIRNLEAAAEELLGAVRITGASIERTKRPTQRHLNMWSATLYSPAKKLRDLLIVPDEADVEALLQETTHDR